MRLPLTRGYRYTGAAVRVIALLLITVISLSTRAQKPVQVDSVKQVDLIDIAKKTFRIHPNKKRPDKRRVYFSLFPATSNLPGGALFVTSTTAGFYLGNQDNTFLSSVTFSPYLNFRGRYMVSFHSNLWLNNNRWVLQGDTRFSLYPQYTWGLGSEHAEGDRLLLNYKYIRFYESILRRVKSYFLVGAGYNLDYHIHIRTINDTIGLEKFSGYQYGTATGSNSFSGGLTLNLLYDSRTNLFNPLPGAYANLVYRINPQFLGNPNPWNSLYLDLREYIALNKKSHNVLAFWSFLWTVPQSGVPYLDLPSIGWDPYQRSGRGIQQNRYRGTTLIDFESEYRRDITDNGLLGFVVFANMNTVTEPVSHRLSSLHPAAGTGIRIKLNKHSNTNIGLDVGFSQDNTSLYLSLGEAF
jgi:hypothetical protein